MSARNSVQRCTAPLKLLLCSILVATTLLLVISGAQAFRGMESRAATHGARRIARAMVRTALWADDAGGVSVEETSAGAAIRIDYDYSGERFVKRLYLYGGALRELYAAADRPFNPEQGEALCALGRFEPRMEDGRMVVEMTDAQGGDCSVCVSLRAEVGA